MTAALDMSEIGKPSDSIVGVLLAGGLSRRMGGGDKSLKLLGGHTLLDHAAARLRPQVSSLIINANGDPGRFAEFGLSVVPDPIPDFAGPLAGVLAGLSWARQHRPETRWIATAACDTPFFPENMVAVLHEAAGDIYPIIVLAASGGRIHPVFGLWPTALADELRAALDGGMRKVLDWAGHRRTAIAEFPPAVAGGQTIDPFFNANRPEELLEAERILQTART